MTSSERPVFYYDLGSPYSYLAAERIHSVFDEPLRIPVASIPVYDTDPFKLNLNTQTFDLVV